MDLRLMTQYVKLTSLILEIPVHFCPMLCPKSADVVLCCPFGLLNNPRAQLHALESGLYYR